MGPTIKLENLPVDSLEPVSPTSSSSSWLNKATAGEAEAPDVKARFFKSSFYFCDSFADADNLRLGVLCDKIIRAWLSNSSTWT